MRTPAVLPLLRNRLGWLSTSCWIQSPSVLSKNFSVSLIAPGPEGNTYACTKTDLSIAKVQKKLGNLLVTYCFGVAAEVHWKKQGTRRFKLKWRQNAANIENGMATCRSWFTNTHEVISCLGFRSEEVGGRRNLGVPEASEELSPCLLGREMISFKSTLVCCRTSL